ncbi:MAG: type II secretion system F family protein [Lachnospiraceae bacterium]|nr:type II secretion system F family protein [Lachnospiraceae bacterium]
MAVYKYEIIDPSGKHKKGTIDANDELTARQTLKTDGSTLVSISMAGALDKEINISFGAPVKPKELAVFCNMFKSILAAGVTIIEALGMLAEQTENKKFKAVIEEVHDDVQKGETLSSAFAKHPKFFPEMMIQMANAGEASGSLETSFERLSTHFEKDAHLKALVAKSMVYPIILICVIVGVVILMMTVIVPQFTSTFDDIGAELPGITKAVMAVSDMILHWWWLALIIIIGVVVFLKAFKKTERGALLFGKLMLHMPLFGPLSVKTAAARFTRTLSTLISSGMALVEAIHITGKIMTNAVVQAALVKAEQDVTQGFPLSVPLMESEVFPVMVPQMVKIGEETGSLDEMLSKIANYYDEEVEIATEALVAAMEPLIIIVMAGTVVPIILAVLMPMFSLYSALG